MRALLANAVQGVSRRLHASSSTSSASATAPRSRAARCSSRSATRTRWSIDIPEGIKVEIDARRTAMTVTGADRQQVGQVAAEIRGCASPTPTRARASSTRDEVMRRKVGKAGGK